MITVKVSQLESNKNYFEKEIIDGELLSKSVTRSLDGIVTEDKIEKSFTVVVNGLVVGPQFWQYVALKKGDLVTISPKLKGDDAGALLRVFATVIVSVIVGPWAISVAGGPGIVSGLITAAAITLVGALIPPPMPQGLEGSGLEGSQTYTITGQQNDIRRFNTVPKVYGTHRIFPPFAATPYTELETDPDTGGLLQFFYAIYDLGLGPVVVDDLKIGDTPIEEYSDVQTRLVDLNKPAISEGVWDEATQDSFLYYKGDVSTSSVSVGMNVDEAPTEPEENYTVIRNAASNTGGFAQEISLNFIFPSGLFSFSSNGAIGTSTVDLDIEFSKVSEDIWYGWNDLDKVNSFKGVGGDAEYLSTNIELFPPGTNPPANGYPLISQNFTYIRLSNEDGTLYYTKKNYGILKGTTEIVLKDPGFSMINKVLRIRGELVGKITAEVAHINPLYKTYTFETPISADTILFYLGVDNSNNIVADATDVTVGNKVFWEGYTRARGRITRSEQNVVYADFRFTPLEVSSYKVRVIRRRTINQYTSDTSSNMTWSSLTTRFDVDPIQTTKRHTFIEIKIRATDQLNGTIQNLSAVCSSVLDVYNGTSWEKQVTSNPAWVFSDLLTGEVNKRAIDKTRLDTNSLEEWADFCNTIPDSPPSRDFVFSRFNSNFILDFNPTLQSALNMVTNAGQASLNIIDGKYGVLIDKLKTVPVQLFTQRNSSGFSSVRSYVERPNGLKVSYIDPSANWEEREAIVYDSGFDEVTALTFEEVKSFGCTNFEQAWRLGRYMLAQNRLRQETISITVDFENLICTRGDYVQITQDVMKVGGTPARVKSRVGNQIVIDEGVEIVVGSYGFLYRSATGQNFTNTLTVDSADTFTLDGVNLPNPGDLIVIGLVGQIVFDCIVKSIEPQDDLKAQITLVEKADAIYTAESTDTLDDYSPQIATTSSIEFTPPGEVIDLIVQENSFECIAGGPSLSYFISLDWDVPTNTAFEIFEVYVDVGQGYNLVDFTKQSLYTYTVARENLGSEHSFKILAVSASGKKLQLADVSSVEATPMVKSTPPQNVEIFNSDITGEVLQLFWTQVTDCSVKEYLIRYSPVTNNTGAWERSIPLTKVDRNTNLTAVQARTGTYFIKAVDYEDNESLSPTAIITTIPELFGLNVITETNDFPSLPGVLDRVVTDSGGLTLDVAIPGDVDTQEYYSEGFYYYENLLDLGDIYTVRIQSLIEAEGFTLEDLMANWVTLADLTTMSHAGNSDWDVETYYRITDQYNVMSEWTTLSSIDPISEGNPDIWSEWRKFTIGDVTGRNIQFRLRLVSNKVSVTPRVFDGRIKADMPDRVESFNDLLAPTGGLQVDYDPDFYGPGTTPAIAISMQSAQSGDYWSFDTRTLSGFYIRFFDSGNNPVARSFDAQIKGFGFRATSVI